MKRILESELMDEEAQASAYAKADFEEPHNQFIYLFKQTFEEHPVEGNVLDLGCGPGDITFRFARAFPRCVLYGVDGAKEMLAHGRAYLAETNEFKNRVKLIQGVLPQAELPLPYYDVVISNSLLHHLHNPQVLWNAVQKYGATGALVFIMDLKRPPSIESAQNLVATYAAEEPEVLQKDFHNSLLAAFEPNEIQTQLETANLSYFQVQEISDRHMTITGILR